MPEDTKKGACGECNLKTECSFYIFREKNYSRLVADQTDACALFPAVKRIERLVADLAQGEQKLYSPTEIANLVEAVLSGAGESATCEQCPVYDDCEHVLNISASHSEEAALKSKACAAFLFIARAERGETTLRKMQDRYDAFLEKIPCPACGGRGDLRGLNSTCGYCGGTGTQRGVYRAQREREEK